MAGKKKKTKPASNPARGFATTSIASKPRAEAVETPVAKPVEEDKQESTSNAGPDASKPAAGGAPAPVKAHLSPEEFEKQLEEQELQNLAEKHAQKARRDATRQVTRLQTDRRLLRGQADFLNTRRWLPSDLMEEVLELVQKDYRYSQQSFMNDAPPQKPLSEEDLTIKLWALEQALEGAGFPEDKSRTAMEYVLSISDKIVLGNKDNIWGLEEALQWLAVHCSRDELPDYESFQTKALLKTPAGMQMNCRKILSLYELTELP